MTTVLQLAKKIVSDSIDHEYLEGKPLREVYLSEYGFNGISQDACTNYLRGLPSVCSVPFMNFEILQILSDNGISRKGENAKIKLIEDYWNACGCAFYLLIKN